MVLSQTVEGVSEYQELSQLIQEKTFDTLVSKIKFENGWRIIDVGCGTGNNSVKLANFVGETGKIIATDPMTDRIETAVKTHNIENLEFHVAYGKDSSTYGKDFDLAMSSTVLHWIPPEEKLPTFKSIFDSLKQDGMFAFNTVKNNTLNIGPIAGKLPNMDFVLNNYHPSSREELEELARKAGFNHVDIIEKDVCIPLPDLDYYLRWFACSVHVANYDTVLADFRKLCETEDTSCLHDENGKVTYKQTYYFGYCK